MSHIFTTALVIAFAMCKKDHDKWGGIHLCTKILEQQLYLDPDNNLSLLSSLIWMDWCQAEDLLYIQRRRFSLESMIYSWSSYLRPRPSRSWDRESYVNLFYDLIWNMPTNCDEIVGYDILSNDMRWCHDLDYFKDVLVYHVNVLVVWKF